MSFTDACACLDRISPPTGRPRQLVLHPDGEAPRFSPLREGRYVPSAEVARALEQGRRIVFLDARADRASFPDGRHERVRTGVLESAIPMGETLWGAASSDAEAMAGLRIVTPTGVAGALETGGSPSRIAVHGELAILMSPNERRIDVVRVR